MNHPNSSKQFNIYKNILIHNNTKYHEFRIEGAALNPFDAALLIRLLGKTQKDILESEKEKIETAKRNNDIKINGWKKSKAWSRISFEHKKIIFRHGSSTFSFNITRSIEEYNYIKKYFSYNNFTYSYNLDNNVPVEFMISDKILDVLEKAVQREDFSDFKFRNYTSSGYWYGGSDSWSLASLLGYDKKEYFDYLMRLANDKVIFLNENKSYYSSDTISIELTFLIIVDKGRNRYYLWESSKPNTATIIFETIANENTDELKQSIIDFLISPIYNKRQNLRKNRVGFLDGIINTHFIRHNEHQNIIEWKMKLNNILRTK